MEAGIVGLPNVGKSTLFNALTSAGAESANYPFCTIEPNVGIVAVPDPRLALIQSFIKTERVIPAVVRLVDIAGIVKGASEGAGLGNKFLSHIRGVDAILHVVRCFEGEDIIHVDNSVDPLRDIETIETELLLADLQTVEGARDKAARTAKSGDAESKVRLAVLTEAEKLLAEGLPVRQLLLSLTDPAERKALAGFQLLTAKRVLYVANVAEDDVAGNSPLVQRVRERAAKEGGTVVPVCAKIEAELAELAAGDRAEMLDALGLVEPALATLTRSAYGALDLQSYFTAGEKEIRAWTIPIGATAPQAAGVIHSDFERAFIRAEIYSVDDLKSLKTEKAIREAGRLRVEGKAYVMRDGDICHFLTGA